MGLKIAILASGEGTNLQALLDAGRAQQFHDAEIVLVAGDKPLAGALKRAAALQISTLALEPAKFANAVAFDQELLRRLAEVNADVICLAGYMRILTPAFVQAFPNRILNIHPALLPAFGGCGMYGHHVHEAVLKSGVKFSGCTVHFVDEGTDTGPIILQAVVPVLDSDTPASLAERVLIEEHRIYPRALALYCEQRLRIEGKRVLILEKA
jgi:phosphoribosylglycinamide formyltransferase-1